MKRGLRNGSFECRHLRNFTCSMGTHELVDVPSSSRRTMFAFKLWDFKAVEPSTSFDPKLRSVPKPRSGHRMITDDEDNVYSFGGYNPWGELVDNWDDEAWSTSKPLFNELWKYSPVTKSWSRLKTSGDPPKQLASHSAVYFRGNMIVYGGTGVPFGHSSSNKVYSCDLKSLTWVLLQATNIDSDPNIPLEQYGQGVVIDQFNECLYVVGGTNGFNYTIDVHKFCLRTKTWTELWRKRSGQGFPEERYRHELILFENKLFVMGGGTAMECFDLHQVPVFDIETRSWSPQITTGIEIPQPRRCHGCVQIEDDIYVFGGTSGTQIFKDIWKLNLRSFIWTKVPFEMPIPLFFHGVTLSNSGRLTIFGGVNEISTNLTANIRTGAMFEAYIKLPPLEEIAWMSFLNYCDLDDLAKSSLKGISRLGIPHHLINRLTFGLVSDLDASVSSIPHPC